MFGFWEIWGIAAGLITTSGYIPQIIQGYKTKSLKDLSYLLNALMGLGMLMWFIYGLSISSVPIIVANIIGVTLNATLIFMKFYYAKKSSHKK